MIQPGDFEDMRPYRDEELPAAIGRLLAEPSAHNLMRYVFPDRELEEVLNEVRQLRSIRDLQRKLTYPAIGHIIATTTCGLSHEGIESLDDAPRLYLSNHRDIILDSALLCYLLSGMGRETVEIGTGDNLLLSQVITDLMKLNRAFVVHRNLTRKDFYAFSLRLSTYIRQRIAGAEAGIWIAQRNGRTKNGDDRTDTALLKMLALSGQDFEAGFAELRITPLAISYEYDPCDALKAFECFVNTQGETQYKTRKDDLKSMLSGVTDPKGRVHFAADAVIGRETLAELAGIVNLNERFLRLTQLIDHGIHRMYRLWPVNYIAADLLNGTAQYAAHYNEAEKQAFEAYVQKRLAELPAPPEALLPHFLAIYANPVKNAGHSF